VPRSPLDVPQSLARRFEVAESEVTVGGRTYRLLKPRNVDDLISEEDFAIDERIPYWADVWPSARILAERLSKHDGAGKRLLELGCGIGLPAIAAAAAGYEALATDYYAEALEFTEANAQRNGVDGVDSRLVDWRRLPDDLGVFDLVVAADVLYEKPQAALVVAVIEQCLAEGGLAIVTDPGRRTADALLEICRLRGLSAELAEKVPTTDAGAALHVSVFEIRRG
jgi:predicted nicotinamide N-methyase